MKKSICLIVSLIMVLAMIPTSIFADAAETNEDSQKELMSGKTKVYVGEENSEWTWCVGDKYHILYSVKNPSGKTTFKSSNTKVLKVDSKGNFKAVGAGTAKVYVKNNGVQKSTYIYVEKPYISDPKTIKLRVKKTRIITYWIGGFEDQGKHEGLSFKSSNTKIAKVSSGGKITANKPGKCTITATYKNNGYTFKMKRTVKVSKPKLNKSNVRMSKKETKKLKVLGGDGKIRWKSSNSKVATVSSEGLVTAKKNGTCTITAKRNGYVMKCKVTVAKKYYSRPKHIQSFEYRYGVKRTSKSTYEDLGGYYDGIRYGDFNDIYFYRNAKLSQVKKYCNYLKSAGFKVEYKNTSKTNFYAYLTRREGGSADMELIWCSKDSDVGTGSTKGLYIWISNGAISGHD